MSQVEVLALLVEQETACQAEVDRLRAEAERIAVVLAEREGELAEIATACRVVGRLPALSAGGVESRPVAPTGSPVSAPGDAGDASWQEIAERIPGVLAMYPGAVRAAVVARDLGLESVPRQVERVRHALKRSVAGGVAVAVPGGAFALKR
jgi:hypothetical protein